MASSTQNAHSHHRFFWKGRELAICLKSSGSSVGADSDPHMLVEVTLDLYAKFPVPSPGGGFYDFGCYVASTTRDSLKVDNPSLHFSTLDDSQRSFAPLVTSINKPPLQGKILEVLGPDLSRLAHDTLQSAEVQGHTAVEMVANAVCFLREDLDSIVNYYRMVDGAEEVSLGTCAVCLDEIQNEWIRPVELECSHIFHLGCIAPWLQRQNSCPLCRSRQPIIMEL